MKLCKSLLTYLLIASAFLPLVSCAESRKKYTKTVYDYFDTVITVTGYADRESDFTEAADLVFGILAEYHRVSDAYTPGGDDTLYALNLAAGQYPVAVGAELFSLLSFARDMCIATDGAMNPMLGGAVFLWQEAMRDTQNGDPHIPDAAALEDARQHSDIASLVLDPENGTAFIRDGAAKAELGAVAKGYAVEKAAVALTAAGYDGYIIDAGGNIRTVGRKPGNASFIIGVRSPFGGNYIATLPLCDAACVTSGSYIRTFTVDNQEYHHLLDPDTAMPARRYVSVSVTAADSGIADALSTALFVLPYEDGLPLIRQYNASALYIFPDGRIVATDGSPFSVHESQ